jgi:hypothetical protein
MQPHDLHPHPCSHAMTIELRAHLPAAACVAPAHECTAPQSTRSPRPDGTENLRTLRIGKLLVRHQVASLTALGSDLLPRPRACATRAPAHWRSAPLGRPVSTQRCTHGPPQALTGMATTMTTVLGECSACDGCGLPLFSRSRSMPPASAAEAPATDTSSTSTLGALGGSRAEGGHHVPALSTQRCVQRAQDTGWAIPITQSSPAIVRSS